MKILVTGASGRVGSRLVPALKAADHDVISSPLMTPFSETGDLLIHLAAKTDVDACETDPVGAWHTNVKLTHHLVHHAAKAGMPVLMLSTDYVFDGTSKWSYRPKDIPHPLSVYGWTKMLAERAVLSHPKNCVVRTAWLGIEDFLKRLPERAISDQYGSPTFVTDLVSALVNRDILTSTGILHIVNDGVASWYDVARVIDPTIKPIHSKDLHRPAPRPYYSVLSSSILLPHWRTTLPGGPICSARAYLRSSFSPYMEEK